MIRALFKIFGTMVNGAANVMAGNCKLQQLVVKVCSTIINERTEQEKASKGNI